MHPPDPLRLCMEPRCTVRPHFENCSGCLGFGLATDGVPLTASAAERVRQRRAEVADWSACPVCFSTPYGPDPLLLLALKRIRKPDDVEPA